MCINETSASVGHSSLGNDLQYWPFVVGPKISVYVSNEVTKYLPCRTPDRTATCPLESPLKLSRKR